VTYRLKFVPPALEEWNRLDGSVKEPLRKLLKKRLASPHIPGARSHGELANCYKIKLLKQGYRLVYTVIDEEVVVLVLSVDKREDALAYEAAKKRLKK
jgi:mRNA interferase RelE/StbE